MRGPEARSRRFPTRGRAASRGLVFALAVCVSVGACATGRTGSESPRHPDVLTREEMRNWLDYSAARLIRQLRPNWLNDRRGSVDALGMARTVTGKGIRVYVDGVGRTDGLRALEQLHAEEISEMRKLDAPEATQRFGFGHGSGAILVTTIH